MPFSFRPALFIAGFSLFAMSCAKSGADSYTGPGSDPSDTTTTTTGTACPIAQENYTQPGTVDPQWNIYYDADGDFFNAAGYNSSGMKTSNVLSAPTSLGITTDGVAGTYSFAANFFTGQPAYYSLTNSPNRNIAYNTDKTISQITLTDSAPVALATINLSFGTGNLTQFKYQALTGDSTLSTFYIDTYDGKSNPMHDLKGSGFLFYNWEYFSTPFLELGRVFEHLSTNNWTHYFCMQNGVKILEETITYQYNSNGYPTTGSLHVVTYSSAGVTLTDNTYKVTYTYPC